MGKREVNKNLNNFIWLEHVHKMFTNFHLKYFSTTMPEIWYFSACTMSLLFWGVGVEPSSINRVCKNNCNWWLRDHYFSIKMSSLPNARAFIFDFNVFYLLILLWVVKYSKLAPALYSFLIQPFFLIFPVMLKWMKLLENFVVIVVITIIIWLFNTLF